MERRRRSVTNELELLTMLRAKGLVDVRIASTSRENSTEEQVWAPRPPARTPSIPTRTHEVYFCVIGRQPSLLTSTFPAWRSGCITLASLSRSACLQTRA